MALSSFRVNSTSVHLHSFCLFLNWNSVPIAQSLYVFYTHCFQLVLYNCLVLPTLYSQNPPLFLWGYLFALGQGRAALWPCSPRTCKPLQRTVISLFPKNFLQFQGHLWSVERCTPDQLTSCVRPLSLNVFVLKVAGAGGWFQMAVLG